MPWGTPLSFMPSPSLYRGEGDRKRGCPHGLYDHPRPLAGSPKGAPKGRHRQHLDCTANEASKRLEFSVNSTRIKAEFQQSRLSLTIPSDATFPNIMLFLSLVYFQFYLDKFGYLKSYWYICSVILVAMASVLVFLLRFQIPVQTNYSSRSLLRREFDLQFRRCSGCGHGQ